MPLDVTINFVKLVNREVIFYKSDNKAGLEITPYVKNGQQDMTQNETIASIINTAIYDKLDRRFPAQRSNIALEVLSR